MTTQLATSPSTSPTQRVFLLEVPRVGGVDVANAQPVEHRLHEDDGDETLLTQHKCLSPVRVQHRKDVRHAHVPRDSDSEQVGG